MLRKFESKTYYEVENNSFIIDEKYNSGIKLKPEGIQLVSNYYSRKYLTHITLPFDNNSYIKENGFMIDWEFFRDFSQFINPIRKKLGQEYREAFILCPLYGHKIPIIYLREKGQEFLLYANSLSDHTKNAIPKLQDLSDKYNINILIVEEGRQADILSCGIDALVLSKVATAKDKKTQEYCIPQLLTKLCDRATPMKGYKGLFSVKLLNEFLTTTQISKTFKDHEEADQKKIIHKKETLAEFRKRYCLTNVMTGLGKKDLAGYLIQKGFKYANIIEIEFYNNQLKTILPELWTPAVSEDFFKKAKAELKSQPALKKKSSREGLYSFVIEYMQTLQEQHSLKKCKPVDDSAVPMEEKLISASADPISIASHPSSLFNSEKETATDHPEELIQSVVSSSISFQPH